MASVHDSSAIACVLLDRWLLASVGEFLAGLPLDFHEIHQHYLSTTERFVIRGAIDSTSSDLWVAVMQQCELRLVEKLYAMKFQPQYASLDLVQKADVPTCAASYGRLDVLQWFETKTDAAAWSSDLLHLVMEADHCETARWLLAHHPHTCAVRMAASMTRALEAGDFELFKTMATLQPEAVTDDVAASAASTGSLDVVRFLDHQGVHWTAKAMDCACRAGHLEVIQFLHDHHSSGSPRTKRVACGDETCAFDRNEACSTDAMDWAATRGHLSVVGFLHENRSEGCTTYAIDGEAHNGHWDVVKFLVANRSEGCTEDALASAVEAGNFDMLVCLYEATGLRPREYLTTRAFRTGRLDVAQYVGDTIRSPRWESELVSAVSEGDLELVQFLHENRSERSTQNVIMAAGRNGSIDIIDFVLQHREEKLSQATFDYAVRTNCVALVKHLHDKFGFSTSCMPFSIHWGHGDLVQYLHDIVGVPLPDDALETAACQGQVELVAYIWKNGGGNVDQAIKLAAERDHEKVVMFLNRLKKQYIKVQPAYKRRRRRFPTRFQCKLDKILGIKRREA